MVAPVKSSDSELQGEDAGQSEAVETETLLGAASPDRSNPKVRQLLDAAYSLFLEQPYDAVSTDAIARAAKVSKATLYAHFASKEALFASLVQEQCGQIASDVWQSTSDCEDVEVVLSKIARNFVSMFATGRALAFYRIIIAQVPRFPELGQIFFDSGPRILMDRIADFLSHATERGQLDVPAPKLAAVQFIQLIAGDIPLEGMLGLPPKSPAEVDAFVDSGIALFMAGYGVRGGRRAASGEIARS